VCSVVDDHNGDPVAPPDDPSPGSPSDRAWAAPEAVPEDTPPSGGAPAVATVESGAGPDIPVPLRPMTLADLLDGGFAILKAQPRMVLALTAVFVVPLQLVVAFLSREVLSDLDELFRQVYSNPGLAERQPTGSTTAGFVNLIGGSVVTVLIAAGVARLVMAWYGGHSATVGEVLRSVLRSSPSLLVAWLVIHVLEVGGLFLFGFPALVVMAFFLVTAPAIAVEGLGPFRGLGRASHLARRRFWPVMGIGVVTGILAALLAGVLALIPQLLAVLIGPDVGWIVLGVGSIAADLVARSFLAGATVLLYLDLRIRTEGLDLAWAAERDLPQ
jgi:hypothetical protein